MIVLAVIGNLGYGGAERQLIELSNAIDKNKCEFHIAVLSDHKPLASFMEEKECRLHVIPKKNAYDFAVVIKLFRLIKKLNADIVQGFLIDAEIAARLAGFFTQKPVIGSERNSTHVYKKIHSLLLKLTKNMIVCCVANNHAGVTFHKNYFKLPESKYRVIHNGVNIQRFHPRKAEELRTEVGLSPKDRVVGIFGSFKRQKNHELFFRGMKRVVDGNENIKVVVVGSRIQEGDESNDSYGKMIYNLVDILDIRNHCIFLGSREDVERYYNLCDVTVLTSLFEGTPNVALESMACGVPVVATDVGDNAVVIPHKKAGFIFKLGDELALAEYVSRLIGDERLRKKYAEEARTWVLEKFSIQRMTERYLAVYDEVLDGSFGNVAKK